MAASPNGAGTKWAVSLLMGLVIAYAAGTAISALLGLVVPLGADTGDFVMIVTLVVQIVVGIVAVALLLRIEPPERRWAWGCLSTGIAILLGLAALLLTADPSLAEMFGSGGEEDAATAFFFFMLIFGLPMLIVAAVLILVAFILFRQARPR
jgi:hypothetical protein